MDREELLYNEIVESFNINKLTDNAYLIIDKRCYTWLSAFNTPIGYKSYMHAFSMNQIIKRWRNYNINHINRNPGLYFLQIYKDGYIKIYKEKIKAGAYTSHIEDRKKKIRSIIDK